MPNSISVLAHDVRPRSSVRRQGTLPMNQQFGQHAFDQAERFFKDAGNVQAIAEKSVAASREFYGMASTVVHDGAKALTEIADTAWGSTKMLNEKIVQNVTSNMSAAFTA